MFGDKDGSFLPIPANRLSQEGNGKRAFGMYLLAMSESIAQYVADLGLAKLFVFLYEMIWDQLIEKTNNTLIQEQLLLEDNDLTLDKAIIIASQIESAAEYTTKLAKAHELSVKAVET